MTASPAPLVSIVVPCRNERAHIDACLASILAADHPADRLEVLVADGMSDDGTRDRLAAWSARDARLRWFDNPARTTPAAMNAAVRRARGDVVVLMGAHCRYPATYVSHLVGWLERSGADAVGGVCRTLPAGPGAAARAIAVALSHPFGVGNSYFRIGVGAPRWVDTVPFGCYRRGVFERVGLFDEELVRNQDDEFNYRLLARGGRLLLVPEVVSEYVARDSLRRLAAMLYQYGRFKPLVIRKLGRVVTLRQLAPPLFVLALAVGVALAPLLAPAAWLLAAVVAAYALAATAAALGIARREGAGAAAVLALAFPVMHVSYGAGFLHGVVALLVRRGPATPAAVPLTR